MTKLQLKRIEKRVDKLVEQSVRRLERQVTREVMPLLNIFQRKIKTPIMFSMSTGNIGFRNATTEEWDPFNELNDAMWEICYHERDPRKNLLHRRPQMVQRWFPELVVLWNIANSMDKGQRMSVCDFRAGTKPKS